MISSAIWDKSARVNVSKANQIARARTHTKIYLLVDNKQVVFGRLPFRIVVKTLPSCQAL